MSLSEIMLEQLGVAHAIVEDGHEVVPAWRIGTPEGGLSHPYPVRHEQARTTRARDKADQPVHGLEKSDKDERAVANAVIDLATD